MKKISEILSEFDGRIESKEILRRLPKAHAKLAELKTIVRTFDDKDILINAMVLQEAKSSTAIDKIMTTHDDLYKAEIEVPNQLHEATEEVQIAAIALKGAFEKLNREQLLTQNTMMEIQKLLVGNMAGFRKIPCTFLINEGTGEIIHRPPPSQDIGDLVSELEKFINDNSLAEIDPIIKMAIIHYQFETIHPFYDGNGRTARIINVLYLILQELLDIPALFLSRYIMNNRSQYYELLQAVRKDDAWDDWVLFMIDAIEVSANDAYQLVLDIKAKMEIVKDKIKANYKCYSPELLSHLFTYPYTKIDLLVNELGISRITASNYLNQLAEGGILEQKNVGNQKYYINTAIFDLLTVL